MCYLSWNINSRVAGKIKGSNKTLLDSVRCIVGSLSPSEETRQQVSHDSRLLKNKNEILATIATITTVGNDLGQRHCSYMTMDC